MRLGKSLAKKRLPDMIGLFDDIITISAYELWFPLGFDSGRRVSNALAMLGIEPAKDMSHYEFGLLTLQHLVTDRLLPLFPVRVEIELNASMNNPLRAAGYGWDEPAPAWAWSISADLTADDLRRAAQAVAEAQAD